VTEVELSQLAEILMKLIGQNARPFPNYLLALVSAFFGAVGGFGVNLLMYRFHERQRYEAQLRRVRVKADRDLRASRRLLERLRQLEDFLSPEAIRTKNTELKERYNRIHLVLRNADDIEYGELFLNAIKTARLDGGKVEKRRDYGPEFHGIDAIIKRLEQEYKGPWLKLDRKLFEE
jgi:hypothetical protein